METQSKIVWDFYNNAYKAGFLDRVIKLSGMIMDRDINLIEALSSFEDNSGTVDTPAMDEKFVKEVLPLIKELSDEKAIQGLREIVETLGPVIERIIEEEGDIKAVVEKYRKLGKSFTSAVPVLKAMSPFIIKKASPSAEKFLKERAGRIIGNGITSMLKIVNEANERDPEIIKKFMSNMLSSIDTAEFRKTAGIIIGSFLNIGPKLAGWTLRAVLKRIKKRLAAKGK